MRNLALTVSVLLLIAACGGPSGKEVSMAKQARYSGDKLVLFAAAKSATESKHKLLKSDETTLGLQTIGRWYTPEGLVVAREGGTGTKGAGYDSPYPDGAINLTLVVRLLPEGQNWVVLVEPAMVKYYAGRPNPEKLAPNDPAVPGWATGQVDMLQYEIYNALKPYEVKSPGGVMPAPEPAPASNAPGATPADPAAPAEGSAAPAPAPAQ